MRILSAGGPYLLPCGFPAPRRTPRAKVSVVRACKLDPDSWIRGSKEETKKARWHQVRWPTGDTGSWEQSPKGSCQRNGCMRRYCDHHCPVLSLIQSDGSKTFQFKTLLRSSSG